MTDPAPPAYSIVIAAITKYIAALPDGTTGQKLIRGLSALMRALIRHIQHDLKDSSPYAWLHATRRYFIMKRVESRPVGYRSMSGFPFNYLERLILWLLTALERAVTAFVDKAIAPRLEKSRKRLDEILP